MSAIFQTIQANCFTLLKLLVLFIKLVYLYYHWDIIKYNFQRHPKRYIALLVCFILGISMLVCYYKELGHFLRKGDNYKIFMMHLAAAGSILSLLAVYYDWDHFFYTYSASPITDTFGRQGARIFYLVLGIFLGLLVLIECYAMLTDWQYPYRALIWNFKAPIDNKQGL